MAKKLPKHYSLVKEHPNSYEINDKRDGNNFHVAKKDLDLQMHANLASLPHFDEGGEAIPSDYGQKSTPVVQDYSKDDPKYEIASLLGDLPASPNIDFSSKDVATDKNGDPAAQALPPSASNPSLVASNGPLPADALPSQIGQPSPLESKNIAAPSDQSLPLGSTSASGQFNQGLNQEIAGIQGQAKEKSKEGDALAQAQYDAQGRMNQIQQDADAARWKLDVEHENLSKAVADGQIDPHRYMHNKSMGNKILAAIAMGLGGAGAAGAHQQNLAYETIQNAIKQDIDAQKENLGTKKSLLSENIRRYGDLEHATQATMMQMNAMTQGQIAQIAAKSGSAQAPFQAQQQIGQLRAANAGMASQYAMRDAATRQLKNGQPMNAIDLVNAGVIPKEYQADAYKEQQSIEAQKSAIDSTKNLFANLNKEQSAGNVLNPQSSRRVAAYNTELVNTVMNASASKRLTRESIEAEIDPLKIKTTDDEATRQQKQNAVLNLIQKHADSTPLMSRYSPRSLPNYAPQAEIKTMNGVKYQKVPGGWKAIGG